MIYLNKGDKLCRKMCSVIAHYSDSNCQVFFQGFLYKPQLSSLPPFAWSVNRSLNNAIFGSFDPIAYNTVIVNVGGIWNVGYNYVTIKVPGQYHLASDN